MLSPTNRLIAFLRCLICFVGLAIAVTAQGQQQSPPVWDRSGMPTGRAQEATGGQTTAANKAGQEVAWERYSSDGEEFSALLPALPSMSSVSRPKKRQAGWLYAAYSDGTVYLVLSLDNYHRKESLKVFVDEFQEYPILHYNAAFERDVTLNGFTGKQYRVRASAGSGVSGIVQFYLTKDHAYIFEVVSDKIESPSVNRFLTSLTLDGKTQGKNIAEASKTTAPPVNPNPPTPSSASGAHQSVDQPQVLKATEVTRKAVVVTRPEPGYTEEARKHQLMGIVAIRAVFSRSGEVTDFRPTLALPDGLTEKAIIAARSMKFIPAVKDGRYVSQYVLIEYHFNLY